MTNIRSAMTERLMGEENGLEGPKLSRREFLVGIAAAAAIIAASGCGFGKEGASLPKEDELSLINPVPDRRVSDLELDGIDKAYLGDLLHYLAERKNKKAARIEAVRNSLRIIQTRYSPAGPQFTATAFEIDESGIYLTAEHTTPYVSEALMPPKLAIVNPLNGEVNYIKGVIKHTSADIAVLFAPSGKPQSPTQNLSLSFEKIKNAERLWMLAFLRSGDELYLSTRNGHVDRTEQLPEVRYSETSSTVRRDSASQLAVKELIPRGGNSGGPIVNTEGRIVAVESGAYPGDADSVSEYKGAVVTPLSFTGIDGLLEQPSYLY